MSIVRSYRTCVIRGSQGADWEAAGYGVARRIIGRHGGGSGPQWLMVRWDALAPPPPLADAAFRLIRVARERHAAE